MQAVLEAGALLPLVDGGFGDAKALGQTGSTGGAGGDLGADGGWGSRVLVQGIIMEALQRDAYGSVPAPSSPPWP